MFYESYPAKWIMSYYVLYDVCGRSCLLNYVSVWWITSCVVDQCPKSCVWWIMSHCVLDHVCNGQCVDICWIISLCSWSCLSVRLAVYYWSCLCVADHDCDQIYLSLCKKSHLIDLIMINYSFDVSEHLELYFIRVADKVRNTTDPLS